MASKLPTPEELKNMTPEERIKILKEIEERRKKELADTKKQVEDELAAAEELIKESETEISEEEVRDEEERKKDKLKKETPAEEEDLEARLAGQKSQAAQQQNESLYSPSGGSTNLYQTLESAANDLQRLYNVSSWGDREKQLYQESKERVERAQTYQLHSERLEEELGLASGLLNRMKYRH